MAFTYNAMLSDHLDWVRYLIGDTQSHSVELQDEEIEALLADEPEPENDPVTDDPPTADQWRAYRYRVAARAAEAASAKHARDADTSIEGQRVGLSAKFSQYRALAKRLRTEANGFVPVKVERW